jgi:hypothetical protein
VPTRAVTIDFHNTLARCDRWFDLEVRALCPRCWPNSARRTV